MKLLHLNWYEELIKSFNNDLNSPKIPRKTITLSTRDRLEQLYEMSVEFVSGRYRVLFKFEGELEEEIFCEQISKEILNEY